MSFHFNTPENMADLAATLQRCSAALNQEQALMAGEAGKATAKLVEGAYTYAADEAARGKADAVYRDMVKAADALRTARAALVAVASQVGRAAQAAAEQQAKDRVKAAGAARLRA